MSFLISNEQSRQPTCEFLTDFQKIQQAAGADRTLDLEVVPKVGILVDEGTNDHELHRHPDRSAPVGVPSKHPGIRVARDITDAILESADVENIGVLGVIPRQRANPVGTEKLILVEQVTQDPT